MTTILFLTTEEIRELTGFAKKGRQIVQLRKMGILFRINGCGKPVVTRVAVEGGVMQQPAQQLQVWQSTLMQSERMMAA